MVVVVNHNQMDWVLSHLAYVLRAILAITVKGPMTHVMTILVLMVALVSGVEKISHVFVQMGLLELLVLFV